MQKLTRDIYNKTLNTNQIYKKIKKKTLRNIAKQISGKFFI